MRKFLLAIAVLFMPLAAMAQYEEDLNNSLFNEDFWTREAFDGNPDAYWNID